MSMLIANQPLLLQTDAAQMQKSASNAGNTGTKAASAARAANSSTVALSSSATAAMARPAQARPGRRQHEFGRWREIARHGQSHLIQFVERVEAGSRQGRSLHDARGL